MQNRFKIQIISFFLFIFIFCNLTYAQQHALWEEYKAIFVSKDGRIVDYYNNHISHSEGQSYGMFLAMKYNDKEVFDRLWKWTKTNLGVRNDHLFAWKWGKRPNGKWGVVDYNNATDGDILVAYALLKADEKWPDNKYKSEGLGIIKSIREKLTIDWKEHTFLLPAYYGFTREDGVVINPSYFIFPAFLYFAKVDEKKFWKKIYKDSQLLITKTRFGSLNLYADWVILSETGISLFAEKPPYFGYDAIRILLFLSWEDDFLFPDRLEKILDVYKRLEYIPRWFDVVNDSISLKPASAGFYAIYACAAKKIGEATLSKKLFKEAKEKIDRNDYYSFSLYLLAKCGEVP